jgi:hypothetical protein
MNSQDFRNLQESYMEVVMNEEKRKYPYSKVHNQNIRLQRNASSETDPEKQEAMYKQADRHREIHTRVRNLPYHQLGNPENRLKPNGKTTSNSTSSQSKQTSSGETTAQRARRDPEFRRQMIRDRMKTMSNEGYDLYDVILSHLLDEGYADTQEAAEVIMVNMSEDWRESICEGRIAWDDKKNPNPSGYTPAEKNKAKIKQLGVNDPNKPSFEKGGPGENAYARHASLASTQAKMDKQSKSIFNKPKGKLHKFSKNPFWDMTKGQVNRMMGINKDRTPSNKRASYGMDT